MTDTNKLASAAGTFKILNLTLLSSSGNSYDIKTKFKDLHIFEDIFSPFISGKITLVDTSDVIDLFSKHSTDLLQIDLVSLGLEESDQKNRVSGTYWIYKRGDRIMTAERTIEITLFFATMEMMIDTHTVVKHSYKDKPVKEVLEDIIKKYYYTEKADIPENLQKKLITNEANNPISRNISFVSNLWPASKCFTFCQNHSIDDEGDATYFFFENKHGFNFLNFNDMVKMANGTPFITLSESNFTANTKDSAGGGVEVEIDVNMDSTIITGARRIGQVDAMKIYQDGGMKMVVHNLDILKKEYKSEIVSPLDVLPKEPLLNDRYIFDADLVGNTDGIQACVQTEYDLFENSKDTTSNVSVIGPRSVSISNFMNNSIELDLLGRTDYTVGQMIEVNLVKKIEIFKGDGEEKYKDFKYSGRYICSAVSHYFTVNNKHTVTLELCRDGVLFDLGESNPEPDTKDKSEIKQQPQPGTPGSNIPGPQPTARLNVGS